MAAQADNVEALALLVELTSNKTDDDAEDTTEGRSYADDGDSVASASLVSRNEDDTLSLAQSSTDHTRSTNAAVNEFLGLASKNLTTPLHIACMNNSQRVVEFLLAHAVRVDFKDSSGDTALHKAGRKQLNGIYQLLVDAGASPSIKNNYGETPRDLLTDNPRY